MPAHLTVLHAAPDDGLDAVRRTAAAQAGPLTLWVDRLLAFRAGVAYGISAPGLEALRARLVAALGGPGRLTAQDGQPFRPHVTVQNRADPAAARALHDRLARGFAPFAARAEGLEAWWYEPGGTWARAGRFAFAPAPG